MNGFATPAAAALLLAAVDANAQSAISLAGQWTGTTKSPSTGNELQIEVTLAESAGTWRYVTSATAKKAGPCFGRDFPIAIKPLQGSKLQLSVDGASVLAGCPNFSLTVERADERTLTGSFGDGRPVTLKRK